jgi:hypothetical protein
LYLWGRKVEAQLMRTLVWGLNLASGDRERGKAAGCEGDGTDERGPLVSVHERGGERARDARMGRASGPPVQRRCGPQRAQEIAPRPTWAVSQWAACAAVVFFFFLFD